jgi:hypothetical protein
MDSLDLSLDPSFCDNSWCFPQPMSVCRTYPSGMVFSSQAELDPEGLCWFKRGDNHLQVYRAQCLLNRYIGGHFGPEWLGGDGYRWPLLLEDGLLNLDTELALKQFQQGLDVPVRGCLCPKTRALLPPLLRFRGSLLRKRLKVPQLRWPPKYSTWGAGTRMGSSGSGSPSNQATDDSDNPPAPPGPAGGAAGKKDDDDKPWTLTLTPNWGFGGSGPLWTGRSGTGAKLKSDTLEVDQKTEFDLSLPTSWALGMGKLKFTIGAEYDTPVDTNHLGKATLAGNFQVQADDLVKNDYVSLSPFLKYSPQFQRNADGGWKESNAFKAGVEFDVDLQKTFNLDKAYKGLKLEADVNSGVQTPGPGNDSATTPTLIVPFEGNINLTWDLPLHTF